MYRGKQFFIDFKVDHAQILVWRFSIGCGFDVDFCTLFRESQLSNRSRSRASQSSGDGASTVAQMAMSTSNLDTATKIFGQISSQLFDKILQRGLKKLEETLRQPEFRSVQLVSPLKKCYGVKKTSSTVPAQLATDSELSSSVDGDAATATTSLLSAAVPITGSFSADKGGGVLRLVWDNSFSRFTGKHIQYCVQCVPLSTMQVRDHHHHFRPSVC